MTKINKPAGFWIRFLARIIDLVIVLAIIISSAFGFLQNDSWTIFKELKPVTPPHFVVEWKYYLWLVISSLVPFIWFVLVPTITKGRTLGMAICRIKIETSKNAKSRFIQIIKREVFSGLIISFNLLLILALFDADLFNKFTYFSKTKLESTKFELVSPLPDGTTHVQLKGSDIFDSIANLRISIVTTITSILFVTLLVFGISIIVRKQRLGFHDTFSKTKTIWENKKIEVKEDKEGKEITSFRPRLVKRENIEWVE